MDVIGDTLALRQGVDAERTAVSLSSATLAASADGGDEHQSAAEQEQEVGRRPGAAAEIAGPGPRRLSAAQRSAQRSAQRPLDFVLGVCGAGRLSRRIVHERMLQPSKEGDATFWARVYSGISQEKVRSTVSFGPPNWTKSRTFKLRFELEL